MTGRTPAGLLQRVRAHLREFFLLEAVSRDLAVRTQEQRRAVRTYHDAGLRRLRAAQVLRGPDLVPATLSLYKEAASLLSLAFLISKDASVDATTLTARAAFSRLDANLADTNPPAPGFEVARPLLLSSDPLELDRLVSEEAEGVSAKLDATTKWLADLVDPRSPRELRLVSVLRIACATLLVAGVVVIFGIKLFAPKNLAAYRPATSSSIALSTTPEGAVDGAKNGRAGFHSAEEDSPWWRVDLGQPFALTRIRVYGRDDCCFEQSVPLALEVSDDGASFRKIAERTEAFSEGNPWEIHPAPNVARFIRLRTMRRSYLVLGEVEVNGHKPK